MARGAQELRESLWCGCAAARCSGVGWSGGSATARGATSDVRAALYLPEGQPKQPLLQPESHEVYASQLESQS